MDEPNISTPTETAPPVESTPAQGESVYGGQPGGHSDHVMAHLGATQSQLAEAKAAQQQANAKTVAEPEPEQVFGKFRAPKLKPQPIETPAAQPATAAAVAPAKAKAAPVIDPVKRATEFVGNYFDEDGDHGELLGRLYDHNYDKYQSFVDHVISSNRDHAARLLGFQTGPSAGDAEFWHLPEHLRQVAADLRPDIWESLSLATPDEQIYHLEREAQLQEAERREWEEEEKQTEELITTVEKRWQDASAKFADISLKEIGKALESFTPLDSKEDNQEIHSYLQNKALAEMKNDPHFARMGNEIDRHLRDAAYFAEQGRAIDSEKSRRNAIHLSGEFLTEYLSILNERKEVIGNLSVFRKAKLWDEYQASLPPEQRAGQSKAAPPQEQLPAIPLGDTSPPPGERFGLNEERKRQLAAELKLRNRQGGQ